MTSPIDAITDSLDAENRQKALEAKAYIVDQHRLKLIDDEVEKAQEIKKMKPVLWIDPENLKAAMEQKDSINGALRYLTTMPREGDMALFLSWQDKPVEKYAIVTSQDDTYRMKMVPCATYRLMVEALQRAYSFTLHRQHSNITQAIIKKALDTAGEPSTDKNP